MNILARNNYKLGFFDNIEDVFLNEFDICRNQNQHIRSILRRFGNKTVYFYCLYKEYIVLS